MILVNLLLALWLVNLIKCENELNNNKVDQWLTFLMPYGVLTVDKCDRKNIKELESFCLSRKQFQRDMVKYVKKEFKFQEQVQEVASLLLKPDKFTDCLVNVNNIGKATHAVGVSIGSGLLQPHYVCSDDYLEKEMVSKMSSTSNSFIKLLASVESGNTKIGIGKFSCYTNLWIKTLIKDSQDESDKLQHVKVEIQSHFEPVLELISKLKPHTPVKDCTMDSKSKPEVKPKFKSLQLNWLLALDKVFNQGESESDDSNDGETTTKGEEEGNETTTAEGEEDPEPTTTTTTTVKPKKNSKTKSKKV